MVRHVVHIVTTVILKGHHEVWLAGLAALYVMSSELRTAYCAHLLAVWRTFKFAVLSCDVV